MDSVRQRKTRMPGCYLWGRRARLCLSVASSRIAAALLLVLSCLWVAFAEETPGIIYDLSCPGSPSETSRLLTTKLKNLLEQEQGIELTWASRWKDSTREIPEQCASVADARSALGSTGARGVYQEVSKTRVPRQYRHREER